MIPFVCSLNFCGVGGAMRRGDMSTFFTQSEKALPHFNHIRLNYSRGHDDHLKSNIFSLEADYLN